jgi:hypothetical protein
VPPAVPELHELSATPRPAEQPQTPADTRPPPYTQVHRIPAPLVDAALALAPATQPPKDDEKPQELAVESQEQAAQLGQDVGESSPRDLRADVALPAAMSPEPLAESEGDTHGLKVDGSRSPEDGRGRTWSFAASAMEQTIERMKERALAIARETAERRARAREEEERHEATWRARQEDAAQEATPLAAAEAIVPIAEARIAFPRSDTGVSKVFPGAYREDVGRDPAADAAMKIQRVWRHHKSRPLKPVSLSARTTSQDLEASRAAAKIQTFWRRHRLPVPKAIETPDDEATALAEAAAFRIQLVWRRHHARAQEIVARAAAGAAGETAEERMAHEEIEKRAALEAFVNSARFDSDDEEDDHDDDDDDDSDEDSESDTDYAPYRRASTSPPTSTSLEATKDASRPSSQTINEDEEHGVHVVPHGTIARRRGSEAEDPGYATQESEDIESDAGEKRERPVVGLRPISESSEWLFDRANESVNGEVVAELPTPMPRESCSPQPIPTPAPERAPSLKAALEAPVLQRWPSRSMTSHTLEPGVYILSDDRFGATFDLSGGDNKSAIAFNRHGWENQQVRRSPRTSSSN